MEPAQNLRDTIIPKSDQLNADELLGGAITVTVTNVSRSSAPDQPICVHYQGDNGKPYKPCKSMRKVLIFAWGDDGRDWIGKSMTLYNDPEVKFGGVKVGGIRISHMSGIASDLSCAITETKGKKKPVLIRKLPDAPRANNAKPAENNALNAAAAKLTAAASNGVEALKLAGAQTPQELIAPLKDHYRALMPIAQKADADKQEPALAGFNPAIQQSAEPIMHPPAHFLADTPPAPVDNF